MFTVKSKSVVGQKLEELLLKKKITPSELARNLELPQSTIAGILTGHTEYPTGRTLVIIANYFNVSVDHLLGRDHIPVLQEREPIEVPHSNLSKIPVIDWEDVVVWNKFGGIDSIRKVTEWVDYPHGIEKKAFALRVDKTYLYRFFPKSGILVIEPARQFKDGDFVLAALGNKLPAIFLIVKFSNEFWLQPIITKKPCGRLTENYVIYGVVARHFLDH